MDDELRNDVDKLLRWFRGNGEAGVFESLRDLEARQAKADKNLNEMNLFAQETNRKLNKVISDREKEDAWRRGVAWTVGIFASIFAIGGGAVAARILSVLNEIATTAP